MAVIADNCPNIKITVVDLNKERINLWNSKDLSNIPIFEPGLKEIIEKVRDKNLFFTTDVESAIENSDMVFISVNTPTKTKGVGAGRASDISWVEACTRQVAKYADGETIVVEKSTIPVKTAEAIKSILTSNNDLNKKNVLLKFFQIQNSSLKALQ